jgi:hypothetical protein
MNKINERVISAAAFLLLATIVVACVPRVHLTPSAANPAEMAGTYTLLLYGCHYPSDVKNVALFVLEGSKYPLDIFDLETSYKVKKGLTAQQAMTLANPFVRCSTYSVWQTQLRKIPDGSGGIVGYELRPLYRPYELGAVNVMNISYYLKEGKVVTYINMDRDVERDLEAPGGSDACSK